MSSSAVFEEREKPFTNLFQKERENIIINNIREREKVFKAFIPIFYFW